MGLFYSTEKREGGRGERVGGPLVCECRSSVHNSPVTEAGSLAVTFSPHVAFSFRGKWPNAEQIVEIRSH